MSSPTWAMAGQRRQILVDKERLLADQGASGSEPRRIGGIIAHRLTVAALANQADGVDPRHPGADRVRSCQCIAQAHPLERGALLSELATDERIGEIVEGDAPACSLSRELRLGLSAKADGPALICHRASSRRATAADDDGPSSRCRHAGYRTTEQLREERNERRGGDSNPRWTESPYRFSRPLRSARIARKHRARGPGGKPGGKRGSSAVPRSVAPTPTRHTRRHPLEPQLGGRAAPLTAGWRP